MNSFSCIEYCQHGHSHSAMQSGLLNYEGIKRADSNHFMAGQFPSGKPGWPKCVWSIPFTWKVFGRLPSLGHAQSCSWPFAWVPHLFLCHLPFWYLERVNINYKFSIAKLKLPSSFMPCGSNIQRNPLPSSRLGLGILLSPEWSVPVSRAQKHIH